MSILGEGFVNLVKKKKIKIDPQFLHLLVLSRVDEFHLAVSFYPDKNMWKDSITQSSRVLIILLEYSYQNSDECFFPKIAAWAPGMQGAIIMAGSSTRKPRWSELMFPITCNLERVTRKSGTNRSFGKSEDPIIVYVKQCRVLFSLGHGWMKKRSDASADSLFWVAKHQAQIL